MMSGRCLSVKKDLLMRSWSLRCPDYAGSSVYREAFSPIVKFTVA